MLDTETKRRIDTCRDILVGKVPDPKSQVEQITIALIYKFMDDMDAEAEELGGKRSFFAGKFGKFGWAKLMAPNMGGFDILTLYSEAIQKMNENPGIPPLFRDIFKNAYLPYRDPETLRMFLKEINGFNYDHSEHLGDAFEYLLSVLGSQGDAGQFRTPRHIIDFMVEVINPQKNETILDPACGTAGFLISSFKHILKNNSKTRPGDKLTPDERTRLAKNIHGYDISPDMVRLSLVNLYLHGFTNPRIEEYDTLTSEDKWNDYADVIMANPPFMTPKGGIKPHKRFSVQSKRSEVLFVDYMAEHLTPTGRAAIIVPEGIIFQSQTAYKQLRKMLVDSSLVAVVSLPAGVFNPYAGVKTSILILDKPLAKKSDAIAFIKIENDGYGLGAQRREIDKNDLPPAADFLKTWLQSLRSPSSTASIPSILSIPNALIVEKTKIAANGDYNLSGERYLEVINSVSTFPLVRLGKVTELITKGTTPTSIGFSFEENGVNFIKIEAISLTGFIIPSKFAFISDQTHEAMRRSQLKADDVLFSIAGALGRSTVVSSSILPANTNQALAIIRPKAEFIESNYLSHLLRSDRVISYIESIKVGVAQYNLSLQQVGEIEIPLPPMEVQKEIVAEIEGYQKVIDGARAVLDNYRPHIPIHPDWPMVALGEVCKIRGGFAFKSSDYIENGIQLIRMGNVKSMLFDYKNSPSFLPAIFKKDYPNFILKKGDLLISMTGTVGKEDYGNVCMIDQDGDFLLNQRVGKFEIDLSQLDSKFILFYANSSRFRTALFVNSAGGVRQANISNEGIENIEIPLPPIETQQQIVAEIEAEQALVAANRELIERFEKKIQAAIARVWGEA